MKRFQDFARWLLLGSALTAISSAIYHYFHQLLTVGLLVWALFPLIAFLFMGFTLLVKLLSGRIRQHRHATRFVPNMHLLRAFAWFCSKENRAIIELTLADLRKDVRQMRKEGRGVFFVGLVIFWHSVCGTMIPIIWDGTCRILSAVLPLGKLIKGIKGIWFN